MKTKFKKLIFCLVAAYRVNLNKKINFTFSFFFFSPSHYQYFYGFFGFFCVSFMLLFLLLLMYYFEFQQYEKIRKKVEEIKTLGNKKINYVNKYFQIMIKRKSGYSLSDLANAISLTSFCLIFIKFIFFIFFNIKIAPLISYCFLFIFSLIFFFNNIYVFIKENIIIGLITNLLGWQFIFMTLGIIEDGDWEHKEFYSDKFLGNIRFYLMWLLYPAMRTIYFSLIKLRILLNNNLWLSRIIIFLIFQFLIFNKFLFFSFLISFILNISRNLFILSDFNANMLISEIKRLFGNEIFTIKNYKIIGFWTLRFVKPRIVFSEKKLHAFKRANTGLGKTYIKYQIQKNEFQIRTYLTLKTNVFSLGGNGNKRYFAKITESLLDGFCHLTKSLCQSFGKVNNIDKPVTNLVPERIAIMKPRLPKKFPMTAKSQHFFGFFTQINPYAINIKILDLNKFPIVILREGRAFILFCRGREFLTISLIPCYKLN